MARISLRAYNRDIETSIDRNQTDEAIAHCRYILKHYPKHIDTYRLMGKALLETQRFSDAADVFHRVLSSVPDDFIAHLGMSIIREDEGNLDAAIWHMERSFEVQPSNAAVQVELRRLYGLRDGLTPQKIQLTRGAMSRMSAKSNLYSQAIVELRAALSDDPHRPDLQVVLAAMYAQTGARIEAIETCNSLINKLPYCLEANRLLAEILPDTERAERAQEYKDRLVELDPYYRHLSPVATTIDQVPDGAVTIERYEYPGEEPVSATEKQPDWAASLGVDLDEETPDQEETPEWLTPEQGETPFETEDEPVEDLRDSLLPTEGDPESEAEGEIEPVQPESTENEDLPDWMGDTEEQADEEAAFETESDMVEDITESSLPTEEELVSEGETEPSPPERTEPEQLPDWMNESAQEGEREAPEWLHEVMEDSTEDGISAAEVAAAAGAAAIISEVERESPELPPDDDEISEEEPQPVIEPSVGPTSELDLIAEEPEGEADGPEVPVEEITDIDGAVAGGVVAGSVLTGAAIAASTDDEEDQGVEADIEPDLSEHVPDSIPPLHVPDSIPPLDEEIIPEFSPDEEPLSSGEIEPDIPIWLQDLGEGIPEEAPTEPESELDTEEAIVDDEDLTGRELDADLEAEGAEQEFPEELEPVTLESPPEDEVLIAQVSEEFGEEEADEVEFPESIPEWLSTVSPETVPDAVVQEISPDGEHIDIVQAEIPEWLHRMEQEHLAEMAAVSEEAESLEALDIDSEFTDLSGEDVPSWLMSAMETEVAGEPIEIEGVESIEEIITVPDEDDVIIRVQEDEEAVLPAPVDQELIVSEPVSEGEILVEPDEDEAFGVEPVSEMEVVEEALLEGDTQPVVVSDELEAETEIEEEVSAVPIEEVAESFEAVGEDEILEVGISAVDEPVIPEDEAAPEILGEAPLTEEDEDAAMAWLESLAAKQGAAEEELLTTPEERQEAPPEWIQEMVPESEEIPEGEDEGHIEEIAAAAVAGAALGALVSEGEDQEGEITDEEAAIPVDETSEWLPEVSLESEQTTEPDIEEMPPVLESELEPEGEQVISPEEEFLESETVEEILEEEPEEVVEKVVEQPDEEIPEWLSGLTEDEARAEPQPEEWSPSMIVEEEVELEDSKAVPGEAKLDLNVASLSQIERIPGIGFIHAQRIVNYRTTSGPFKELDELEKVPGLTPDMIEDLKNYLTVEVVVEPAPTPSTSPDLQVAWESINSGEIDTAVDQYSQIIKSDEHLEEVIRDLQEALSKYPVDASLYQTLGDAYLRADMLQEALDAYHRAEDLIT